MPAEYPEPPEEPLLEEEEIGICFTIMPFGGWHDQYYQKIFRKAIEDAGLEPHRADDLYRPGTIVNDIWTYTKQSQIVLADITDKNPNVLYELGLAHALAKPVILVTESMEDVPFDLRALRVITYDKNAPNWGDILKESITRAIKELLKAPLDYVLPAFLEVEGSEEQESISQHDKELLEIRQELNLLKKQIRSRRNWEPILSEGDAANIINRLYASGTSYDEIVNTLKSLGFSESWIRRIVHEHEEADQYPPDDIPF